MSTGYPTTRRYPRSLAQAWPREHANPITHYRTNRTHPAYSAMLAVAIGVVLALLLVHHLAK
jgi:hypothetical protein